MSKGFIYSSEEMCKIYDFKYIKKSLKFNLNIQ